MSEETEKTEADTASRLRPATRAESDMLVHAKDGGIDRLVEIMRRLRNPADGCPWDLEQTFETIAPYTIEEAYEVSDAIERGDMADLRDELGDLLLQVVYHAAIAEDRGAFGLEDVARAISDKMVRRHPHVFAGVDRSEFDWDALKAAERAEKAASKGAEAAPPSVIDDIPSALPALMRAEKLQRRVAKVGFDWAETSDVLDKISEEAAELVEVRDNGADPDRMEDEFGDLLFVVVNLGRHLKLDPEAALRRTNAKFSRRFRFIEDALAAQGRRPDDATLAEMDALWTKAKHAERGAPPSSGPSSSEDS